MFGASAGFLIDGEDTHKTWLGALFTIIVYALFLVYSSVKTRDFIKVDKTEYYKKVFENDLDTKKNFTNEELGP